MRFATVIQGASLANFAFLLEVMFTKMGSGYFSNVVRQKSAQAPILCFDSLTSGQELGVHSPSPSRCHTETPGTGCIHPPPLGKKWRFANDWIVKTKTAFGISAPKATFSSDENEKVLKFPNVGGNCDCSS